MTSHNTSSTTGPLATKSSTCVAFRSDPVGWAWCQLENSSAGLQSVQILIVGLLAVLGLLRTRAWHRKRRIKLRTDKLEKVVVAVDRGRLTSTARNPNDEDLTAGFSGLLYSISLDGRSRRLSRSELGLVRSLYHMQTVGVLLIGTDDGTLYAMLDNTEVPFKVGSFGSAIYCITLAKNSDCYLGLGSGEVVRCSVSKSPAQDAEVVVREVRRAKRHEGKTFDIQLCHDAVVSVGEGGVLVGASVQGDRKMFETKLSQETLWSLIEAEKGRYIVACNDGSLIAATRNGQQGRLQLHTASIRHLFRSPRGRWFFSVGKDRCLYAVLPNLSASVLIHRTKDYIYHGHVNGSGTQIAICDGAGELTFVRFGIPVDDMDLTQLKVAVS